MNHDRRIRQAFDTIAQRQSRPRPWRDTEGLPWADEAFSRSFVAAEELPLETAAKEVSLLEHYLDGQRVLELGCGGGRTARHWYGLRPELAFCGLDVGGAALRLAKRRCPNYAMVRGDMTALPFASSTFDLVFCIYGALLGFRRRGAATVIRRVRQLLRRQGVVVVEFPSRTFLRQLDGVQEWWIADSSFAGTYPQVGLSENFYFPRSQAYVRRDYVVDLSSGQLAEYGQTNQTYDEYELRELLERAGLQVLALYGDWDRTVSSDEAARLIAVASHKS